MSANTSTPGPGAKPLPPELATRLREALKQRTGPPRTRHLVAGTSLAIYTNRLALEQSPYLLQHAHNPVDWRPWGDEAFDEARARDVPVFLSIGYATCHWCHVMEEESFEDEEIARLLNTQFVCIKIDREERPDVDAIYMQAVQLISGQGGWPMTVFLDHQRRPFYAGTYFPPRDGARGSRHGLTTLANELARLFREERPRTEEAARDLAAAVKKSLLPAPAADLPGVDALVSAQGSYKEQFDPRDGGMRRAPKFPSSINNRFLLRMAAHEADVASAEGLKMAWLSLEKMALGGLFDQLGGGFHRYSTDARWLVPHFEKMLYDNGLLTVAYVEAWQTLRALDGDAPDGMPWSAKAAFFKTVAERTLHWMDAEMSDARGGFFSATDADSEGEEGTYFVWKLHEVETVLGEAGSGEGLAVAKLFDVSPEGNFEGNSVLSLERIPDAASQALLDRAIVKLLEVRAKREPPLTDNKVLTAWNGLAISAFARAGFALHRDDLIARGYDGARISIAPNGVDLAMFGDPPEPEPALAQELALGDGPVIGFIGSFYRYEGLDDLIAAMTPIVAVHPGAKLLLVGGGPAEADLQIQAEASSVAHAIRFVGRVPHHEVERYYALTDVLCYPRKMMRLTDLVTPLKPLEAMAQGKLVAASNVGGHRELIEHGVTGTLFAPDSPQSLAAALSGLFANRASWPERRDTARSFVRARHDWAVNAQRYLRVYQPLLNVAGHAAGLAA